MAFKLNILVLFLSIGSYCYSQKTEKKPKDDTQKSLAEFVFKPTIGLGTGMLSFYGDIYDKHFQAPMVSHIGYELNVAQPINDYLQFDFYVLRGKLGANERFVSGARNLNFESQITAGGVNVMYDFGNFLKKERTASPYITLGIETFEFLSKTDLYDKYGNKYNYWSDGSIRNLSSTDALASSASIVERDYKYETDIRELNADGFGKYHENSWAIPVGIGYTFKISDHFNFKMGATMHFTFTDYIDGVTQNSVGIRAGNSKKDNFMMTSFSLHYDFFAKKKDGENAVDEPLTADDLLTMDYADSDSDGVVDLKDNCPGTPHGIPVDINGCPLDDDQDGIPNYKDEELNTPTGALVDANGVQMSDSLLLHQYNVYMDSTGAFAKVEVHDHNGKSFYTNFYQKEYMVSVGNFKKAVPAETMTKFLSVNDISSNILDDSTTMYTAGKYTTALDAEKRKQELIEQGFADAKVVFKQKGVFQDAPVFKSNVVNPTKENALVKTKDDKESALLTNKETKEKPIDNTKLENKLTKQENKITDGKENSTTTKEVATSSKTSGTVLRVQLGAFRKRLSKSVFHDINDLIEIKTEDGWYKYSTGAFKTIDEAAKHKANMILKGYQDAFITAYKNGNRVSILEAGATPMKKGEINETPDNETPTRFDKKNITFRVQVGKYKNQVPNDKLSVLTKIKDIKTDVIEDGSTRYTVGSFTDYNQAQRLKNELSKKLGLKDAFIIAFNLNEVIPIKDALESVK